MPITTAQLIDTIELATLINSAYRGESSKRGWTTEANLLKGDIRITAPELNAMMENPDAAILKYNTPLGQLTGCVYLEKRNESLYLGLLTVSPDQQAGGIGKQLLLASEEFAMEKNCNRIFMRVITLRTELIAWYKRHGYADSGLREPLTLDTRFPIPEQEIIFMIMEKSI